MATEPQTPWSSQEKVNGSSYADGGGKKRRLRGKRRWPPKVAGDPASDIMTSHEAHGLGVPANDPGSVDSVMPDQILPPAVPVGEDQLIDPELVRVLQSLSSTIDTAHHVLYAAAEATQRRAEPPAQQAYQADRQSSYDRARRGAPPFPPIPPETAPPASRGLKFATAATALIVLGAIGWTIHANPWLLSGEPQTAANDTAEQGEQAVEVVVKPKEPAASPRRTPELPSPTMSAAMTLPKPAVPNAAPPARPAALEAPAQPAPEPKPAAPTRRIVHTVRGVATRPILLGLDAPQRTGDTEVSAMIQGAPEEVALSAGQHIGGGTWIVEANDIEGLSVTAPNALAGQAFTLEITLVTSDGKIPEARTLTVAVDQPPETQSSVARRTPPANPQVAITKEANEPTPPPARGSQGPHGSNNAAQPEQQSAPIKNRLSKDAEARLMKRGNELLSQRDISAARLIFEHAARLGSTTAMVALARTYDPGYLAKLGIPGVKGDQSQAAVWYERAAREADR